MLEGAVKQRISASSFSLRDLRVDTEIGVVSGPAGHVHLEPRVMAVLQVLARNAGGLVSRDDLLRQIWPGGDTYDEALTQCVYQLRQQLASAGGSNAYRDLIATVPKRGYLLKSELTASDLGPTQTPLDGAAMLEPPTVAPSRKSPLLRPTILFGIALLIAAVAIVLHLFDSNPEQMVAFAPVGATAQTPPTIAVLPFNIQGQGENSELLANGLAEELLGALALNPGLRVTARPSAFKFKGSDRDLPTVGRQLGVRYVLDGKVRNVGERVQIQTRLVNTETGTRLWGQVYDLTLADWFELQRVMAGEIASAMSVALDQGDRTIVHSGTANMDAHLELLRAREFLASRSLADAEQAIEHLQRALTLDPKYALAYARMADAILLQAQSTNSLEAARQVVAPLLDKALALDPELGEAYALRSLLADDPAEAEEDLRRGLDLNPSYARGYELLASVQFTSLKQIDLALASIDTAIALDPLTPGNYHAKAGFLMAAGDWAQAGALDHRALELNPEFRAAAVTLGQIAAFEGRLAESIGYMEQALALDPRAVPLRESLVMQYVAAGDLDDARAANQPPTPLGSAAILWAQGDTGNLADLIYSGKLGSPQAMILSDQVSQIVLRQALSDRDFARALAVFHTAYSEGEPLADSVSAWQLYALANLVQLLAVTDHGAAATRLEEEIAARMSEVEKDYPRHARVHDHVRAILLAHAGNSEEACAALEKVATPTPGPRWGFFTSNPAFDSMRHAPCFETLIARADTYFAGERAHLEEMRHAGQIPDRAGLTSVSAVAIPP